MHCTIEPSRSPRARRRDIENGYLDIPGAPPSQQSDFVQAVPESGPPFVQPGTTFRLPVTEKDHRMALGGHTLYYSNREFQGTEFRVLTVPASHYAVQIARPLTEVNRTLHRITFFLVVIAAGGMAVAAALGLLVARTALTPVRRLTETTEAVTETRDLSQRIESTSTGHDELGRLASSFNTMLAALEDSSRAQRQLVADASHELRTPLTSLKTNIEVLARGNELSPESREQLLHDLVEQIDEIAPLLVIWLDPGIRSVATCAFIVSVFPVIANTLAGLLSTDPALADLFRLYGATPVATMLKLRLPSALPNVITGLRIAAGLAVIGTVVAEFQVGQFGDEAGLGVRIVGEP